MSILIFDSWTDVSRRASLQGNAILPIIDEDDADSR
jgi:hypothetical protein